MEILDKLNEIQKEAVLYTEGPLLILAGAGSGKTRVITYRFLYLLEYKNIHYKNILAVTFTNKAANEMKTRIEALLDYQLDNAWIRTFHSTGMLILKKFYDKVQLTKNFSIFDENDSKSLIKSIMKDLGIISKNITPEIVFNKISTAKDYLISPEDYLKNYIDSENNQIVNKIYPVYQERLKKNNAVDFGDLIFLPVLILRQDEDVRKYYHNLWKYIMIDEFQDTNFAQYEFTKLITNENKNICVVGDDDQSIYGWRGAIVDNMYNFKDYFNAKLIKLEQNYRSTKIILEAANSVSSSISGRIPKVLWTDNKKNNKIYLIENENQISEAKFVVNKINELLQDYDYKDFAVFYRTNAQSREIEEKLRSYKIPYRVFGGLKFYDRKEIKDILSYIRLIINPFDSTSFHRIINIPKRKIGDVAISLIEDKVNKHNISYIEAIINPDDISTSNEAKNNMRELGQILLELNNSIENISPLNFVKILIESINYKDYIINYDNEGEERWLNVSEFLNSISNFEKENNGTTIIDFINEISLNSSIDEANLEDNQNYVSLMSIHTAKGLEFSNVFIIGTNQGLLPHSMSISNENEMNEEKRLFYVAITRAKENLFISFTNSINKFGNKYNSQPSEFISLIPADYFEFISNKISFTKENEYNIYNSGYRAEKHIKSEKIETTNKIEKKVNGKLIENIEALENGMLIYHNYFGRGKIVFKTNTMIKVNFEEFGDQVIENNLLSNIRILN